MSVRVGDAMPQIQLSTIDAGVWRGSDQLGHPTVLFCFATW